MKIRLLICIIFCCMCTNRVGVAQIAEDLLQEQLSSDPVPVRYTFKNTRLIFTHSTETTAPGALDFRITHLFDDIAGSRGGVGTFYGLDNSLDIHYTLDYGWNNLLSTGFGRSKHLQKLDGYIKYRLVQQKQKGAAPINITLLSSVDLDTRSKDLAQFPQWIHRLDYLSAAYLSRKISPEFSVLLAPSWLHRNIRPTEDQSNDLWYLNTGMRIKLTPRFSLITESTHLIQGNDGGVNPPFPFGLGAEMETGGHVFSMHVSNHASILNSSFVQESAGEADQGQLRFGFTISRVFQLGRNNGW